MTPVSADIYRNLNYCYVGYWRGDVTCRVSRHEQARQDAPTEQSKCNRTEICWTILELKRCGNRLATRDARSECKRTGDAGPPATNTP